MYRLHSGLWYVYLACIFGVIILNIWTRVPSLFDNVAFFEKCCVCVKMVRKIDHTVSSESDIGISLNNEFVLLYDMKSRGKVVNLKSLSLLWMILIIVLILIQSMLLLCNIVINWLY